MLLGPLNRRGLRAVASAAALGLASASCAGSSDRDERSATSQVKIVAGKLASVAASPVVKVAGPEGVCSGVLVAVNLLVTARHCAAQFTEGVLECTPSGELAPGSPGGGIGADDAPSDMRIYMASSNPTGTALGTPDAIGRQILSTQSPSGCRDDLSFIVLDRSLPIVPIPIRVDRATSMNEAVSVWGYGQTMNAGDPTALREYDAARIVGIGPSVATTLPQLAPVRSVRVGDGAITCDGDSGGPILSKTTGALVALVSIGTRPVPGGGCGATGDSPTTGPRMAEYRALVLQAFAAAGADPNLEPAEDDAGAPVDAVADEGEADSVPEPEASDAPPAPAPGGCAVSAPKGAPWATIAPLLCIAILSAVRRARSAARSQTMRSARPSSLPWPGAPHALVRRATPCGARCIDGSARDVTCGRPGLKKGVGRS